MTTETGSPAGPDPTRRSLTVLTAATLVLAVLAGGYTLYFARSLLLPIVLAAMLNVLLSPVVRRLRRVGVPRFVGSVVVLTTLLGVVLAGALSISAPAMDFVDQLPDRLAIIEHQLRDIVEPMKKVRDAAKQVEEAATNVTEGEASDATDEPPDAEAPGSDGAPRSPAGAAGPMGAGMLGALALDPGATAAPEEPAAPARPAPQVVTIKGPGLVETSLGYAQAIGAGGMVMVLLLLFLLASDDLFLRRLVRALSHYEDKWRAVEIIRAIEHEVSVYLATVTLVNIGLGAGTGLVTWWLGLPHPLLWAVMVALFNYIPYLGAMISVGVLLIAGLVQYDTLEVAALPAGAFVVLTTVEAYLVTPFVLGRRLSLNPVVIFIALMFWAWIWGVPGAILAVPMLVTFKIVADHLPRLAPISVFLSGDDIPPTPAAAGP